MQVCERAPIVPGNYHRFSSEQFSLADESVFSACRFSSRNFWMAGDPFFGAPNMKDDVVVLMLLSSLV